MKEAVATAPAGARTGMGRLQSDERLVRRAKKGDQRAFEAIFERYHQDLYRFCLMLVGSPQDAEDALQSTMVKLLRALPGERRKIRLRPWIYRIARNESIDTIRRRRETTAVEPDDVAGGPELADTVDARARLGRLIEDLGELPERQRAALVMRELEDLEFAEIGSALETSAGTARQTVYEARVSLRQMEVGREMTCERVIWEVSEADGRVTRRREIQAHLRSCTECRAFADSIARRRGDLKAISPLPVAASAALLQGALGAGSGAAGGGLAGAAGAGAGKAVLGSTAVKTAATCAVVAAIGTTAADRGGLIHVPIGGDRTPAVESSQPTPAHRSASRVVKAEATDRSERSASHRSDAADRHSPGTGPGQKEEAAAATPVGGGVQGDRATPGSTSPHGTHAGAGKAGKKAKSKHQGKSPGLPPSSSHGQQTAAEHKSPHGNGSPGTPRGAAKGHATPTPTSQPSHTKGRSGKSPQEPPPMEVPETEPSGNGKAEGPAKGDAAGAGEEPETVE